MPGYCVKGTIGHQVLSGAKKIDSDSSKSASNRQLDVRMAVEYLAFSAHADAKGIMQLISLCKPKNVLLVHGEALKMEFLKQKILDEFGIQCFMPDNGETAQVPVENLVPIQMDYKLLKQAMRSSNLFFFSMFNEQFKNYNWAINDLSPAPESSVKLNPSQI